MPSPSPGRRRRRPPSPGQRVLARTLFAQAAAARLSELPRDGTMPAPGQPGLVICGTANINAVREVPPGQGGFCVTFDPEHVTLHREKGLAAAERAQARTSDYEALIGHRRSTLFDISAISGAAVSPLMGAATRHAYRILFTTTNVRLGVWLPHPAVVRECAPAHRSRARTTPPAPGGSDTRCSCCSGICPRTSSDPTRIRPARCRNAATRENGQDSEREARLWAHVLQLRLDGKWSGALWYRAIQPTLGLLWAEAAGRLSYRATWMYVTDGGHYDNLGLVEALRRGARHIVVLDASGDKADTWFTLGGAIALARADAGVDIDLEPDHDAPSAGVPWPQGKWPAHGRMAGSAGRRSVPGPAAGAGGDLGLQARLVDRRALGRPCLRQAIIRPTPPTARWSSCTTPPSSRPTSSSAPPPSWMRSRAADRLSSGWPRQRPRLRPAAPSWLPAGSR